MISLSRRASVRASIAASGSQSRKGAGPESTGCARVNSLLALPFRQMETHPAAYDVLSDTIRYEVIPQIALVHQHRLPCTSSTLAAQD